MNIKFIILSIRKYGVGGILSFIKRKIFGDELDRFLNHHLDQSKTPEKGITIIGNLDRPASLGKVLRDLTKLLKAADIPCQVLNLPSNAPIPASEYEHLLTPRDEFITNRYSDVLTIFNTAKFPDSRCRLCAIKFWEFEDGLKEMQPDIIKLPYIVAMSDFNLEVLRRTAPQAKVRKILYPFQFSHGSLAHIADTRRKYNIPEDAFTAFFNFDFQSSYYRKNPEGTLRAFAKAFAPNDRAVLVFKTMRAKKRAELSARLRALAEELGIAERLIMIDDFIPQEDLVNLTNACDVYISLHRGEGFGLGIAEAMTLGKPVIVTDYSATTEFCNAENAIPIPYEMVDVRPDQIDVSDYNHVTRWTEPDIDAAAKALRRLYDDPALRRRMGENGRKTIREHFSIENFKKSIEAFLSEETVANPVDANFCSRSNGRKHHF